MGEEGDLFGDGAAEIVEGFANIGGIVVGFVRVLGATRRGLEGFMGR